METPVFTVSACRVTLASVCSFVRLPQASSLAIAFPLGDPTLLLGSELAHLFRMRSLPLIRKQRYACRLLRAGRVA